MKILISLACFVLLVATPVATYSFDINGRYLNYGNGLINMDNVTHINPTINYVVTLPQDKLQDYFKQFGTSNVADPAQTQSLQTWFNSEYLDDLDYYLVEIEAYIKFDDFTLTMIPKQMYLKLPSDQDIERVKAAHGGSKFMRFFDHIHFEHIQNTFHKRAEFEAASTLSQRDSSKIRSQLHDLSSAYRKLRESDRGFWWWLF